MLPKKNRLDTKTVEKVFTMGTFADSPTLSFRFIKNLSNTLPRISFVVPKNIAKKAVDRNNLRRIGYSVIKDRPMEVPYGVSGVFVFKSKKASLQDLSRDINLILKKI
jgi:ribonuclease P protein component